MAKQQSAVLVVSQQQTRETLRKYFAAGRMPSEQHFRELIDSMLNMQDEGFRKSPRHGLEVSAAADRRELMSFFSDLEPASPSWVLRHGTSAQMLRVDHGGAGGDREQGPDEDEDVAPLLCLHLRKPAPTEPDAAPQPCVGINTAAPAHALDVAGVAAMHGRIGGLGEAQGVARQVLADGEFHTLIDGLTGCQAFEVMAGVGLPGSGRYALLHAVALNTFNPAVPWWRRLWPGSRSRGIRATSAHYGRRCDRLQLQWEGSHGRDAEYRLRIRSGCDYGDDGRGQPVQIRCSVTRLWFDPAMLPPPPAQ